MKSLAWAGAAAVAAIAPGAGVAAETVDLQAECEEAAEPLIDASLDIPEALEPLVDPDVPLGGSAFA